MIIEFASLGKNPKPFELAFEPEEIDLGDYTRLTTKAEFTGDISREDSKTHVCGVIKAGVETDCYRCLEPVVKEINVSFEDIFVDATAEPTDDEIELAADALDESLIEGDEIDIADVVREQLILATTEKVLCNPDCKGLCPQCGENRNLIDCKCEEKIEDPRWAALRDVNRN